MWFVDKLGPSPTEMQRAGAQKGQTSASKAASPAGKPAAPGKAAAAPEPEKKKKKGWF